MTALKPLILDQIDTITGTEYSPITFQAVARDPELKQGVVLNFALYGEPYGSSIDPLTGDFSWTPTVAGTFNFFVVVYDNSSPQRVTTQAVTVQVTEPLPFFGYDYFIGARALVDYRLAVARANAAGFLNVNPAVAQANNAAVSAQTGKPAFPPAGASSMLGFQGPQVNPNQSFVQLPQGYTMSQFTANQQGLQYQQNPLNNPMSPWLQQMMQGQGFGNPAFGSGLGGNISSFGQQNPSFGLGGGQGLTGASGLQQFIGGLPSASATPGQFTPMNMGQVPGIGQFGALGQFGSGLGNSGPMGLSGQALNSLASNPAAVQQLSQMFQGQGPGTGGSLSQGIGTGLPGTGGGMPTTAPMQPTMIVPTPTGPSFPNGIGGTANPNVAGGISAQQQFAFQGVPSQLLNSLSQQAQQQVLTPYPIPGLYWPGNTPDNSPTANSLQYFVGPLDSFASNPFAPAPERYQLAAGDLLSIHVSSETLPGFDQDLKVDERGTISLPPNGDKVVVRGKTLDQAQALVQTRLAAVYRNVKVVLQLRALRTMQITVLGDAYLPGQYQMPATATLFNALYMFGGPSANGSLRSIEVTRTDGTHHVLDLYEFLIKGKSDQDIPLQPGDTIYIPPVHTRVTLQGEVRKPAVYEAKTGEGLEDLLSFAGGANPTGVSQRVALQTVDPGVGHINRDVDITKLGKGSNPQIFNGDIATVFSVRTDVLNQLVLSGSVDQPGNYQWTDGMRVADLIRRARGLRKEAHVGRADLFRQNPDKTTTLIPIDLAAALSGNAQADIPLAPQDKLVVYSEQQFKWQGSRTVTVNGSVQRPGPYVRSDQMKVSDLLIQAGGLTPTAYQEGGFLQRQNPDGTPGPLVPIDFRKMIAGDPASNPYLQDNDTMIVQSIQDATFIPDQIVEILGAVQTPGTYQKASDMHLRELIRLAGGTMPNASGVVEVANARVPRDTPPLRLRVADVLAGTPDSDVLLKAGDEITLPTDSDIRMATARVMILGEVKNPGPYVVNTTTDRLTTVLKRAGGTIADAFPQGIEFYRDPALFETDAQKSLKPTIENAFEVVAKDDYLREEARSEAEKARLIRGESSQSISIPGIPGSATTSATPALPPSVITGPTVTPARILLTDQLMPTGNIGFNLVDALRHPGGKNDPILQDGDIIVVPKKSSTVSVVGAVTAPSSIAYTPGAGVDYYINHAGGLVEDAARDKVLVITAGGTVIKPTHSTRLHEGDIVWVPTKVMAASLETKMDQADRISKNVTSGAILLGIIAALLRL